MRQCGVGRFCVGQLRGGGTRIARARYHSTSVGVCGAAIGVSVIAQDMPPRAFVFAGGKSCSVSLRDRPT
eukprot:9426403-Pyramimonas_sp.AAC.1